jgi:hypothetical protein
MPEAATTATPITVVIEDADDSTRVDPTTGTIEVDQPDGGVVVQLDAHRPQAQGDDNEFYANLALNIGGLQLGQIANELYEQIEADDKSRQESLAITTRGIDLMGLKLEEPKSSVDSSSGIDGMSSVTNPLLLEAVLKGWANAQAELLPASGPVKTKDDGEETVAEDDLAEALERDMNHYLTVTASEYYPDTSHMLLWGVYFKGSGFKKVYRCPLRRRPVSDSVDAKDLIVSDTTKDLRSCARVTHQIPMRPSVMKRMKMLGAYRDVTLTQPTPQVNQVEAKIASIQGVGAQPERPEDQPYTIWETQCELDLDEYAAAKFKGKGIPLPYLVTLDKDSREILAIRRDWKEEDEECERQRMYVKYPYVPGPGFYGTGMLNILGNASAAMTAAWREALDAGMFASFPGGLMAKLGSRQNTSNFRVAPGEFPAIETNGMRIQDVVMAMPYKDVTPGLMTLMDKITAQCKSLSGSVDMPVGEGVKDIPVGSMLAQIELASKVIAAAHKGMHQAQSEEIELLVDLFRVHPEDFWRLNKVCTKGFWDEAKFQQALSTCNLVPVSDPNVPSHLHRVMKALALLTLGQNPVTGPFLSGKVITERCLQAIKEDPGGGLLVEPQPNAMPSPEAIVANAKVTEAGARVTKAQSDAALAQGKLAQLPQQQALDTAKLAVQREVAATDLRKEEIIHQSDSVRDQHQMAMDRRDHALQTVKTVADIAHQAKEHSLGVAQHEHERTIDHAQHALDVHEVLNPPQPAPKAKT